MSWVLGGGSDAVDGGGAQTGARAGRVVRLVRMVRLVRLVKLLKYTSMKKLFTPNAVENGRAEATEVPAESRVGAAMSDLTNRRVIVLILVMLIVIPQLTINDIDVSLLLGAQFVHDLAKLNATDPATYSVSVTVL